MSKVPPSRYNRYSRSNDTGATILAFFFVIALGAAILFLSTYIAMLLLGGIASATGWNCAIGFWQTMPCVAALVFVGQLLSRG